MSRRPQWRFPIASVLLVLLVAAASLLATPGSAQKTSQDAAAKEQPPITVIDASEKPTYTWTHLENRLTIRAPFNALQGKVRVVIFFSPTCPRCLSNAGSLRSQLLEKNDSDDFRLMIVWVKSLSTDTEDKLPLAIDVIADPRVSHFWDSERVLNAQLIDAIAFPVSMNVYDIFLMYDKDATWEERLPRPGHFFHETKRMPGPWWNVRAFIAELDKGLNDKAFSSPW